MEHVEIIKRIRELLSNESSWVQGHLAVNEKGEVVGAAQEEACRWCLIGAIDYVCFHLLLDTSKWEEIYDTIFKYTDREHLLDFNDDKETTHADVLAFLDKCIEMESS